MAQEPVVIPEKIYFKIGEVCELVGVQAHVLRYWETEFPTLSPQKNNSGQRSYRRRDVEIALRIKQLLYTEMFTIAGAKKKLHTEQREGSKTRAPVAQPKEVPQNSMVKAPTLFDDVPESDKQVSEPTNNSDGNGSYSAEQHDAIKSLANHLLELREMLRTSRT